MKKKLTVVLLLASMLMQSLVGCAQTEENSDDTDKSSVAETAEITETVEEAAEEEEPSHLDALGEKDFGGATYIIIDDGGQNITTEITGDAVNDALYSRDVKVEDMYNVDIVYPEYADSDATAGAIINSVKAGDCICNLYLDALSSGTAYMSRAFRQSSLYNMLELPYMDLSAEWWSTLAYENLQVKGKMYFTAGYITPTFYEDISCSFMNLTVAENHNINASDLYELVYDGEWTVDEMSTLSEGLRYDLNGDGEIKYATDSFGIINARIDLTAEQLVIGAGMKYSTFDNDGNLVIDLVTDQNISVIEKIKEIFNETKGEDYDFDIASVFKDDRSLFLVHFTMMAANDFRDMEADFAILPMPKYNTEQENYYGFMNPHGHAFVAVPLVIDDEEKTGFIAEALSIISYETLVPAVSETLLKGKVARDQESQNMLDIVFASAYLDFNSVINLGGSVGIVGNAVFKDQEIASSTQKMKKLTDKELANIMKLFDDED